MYGSSAILELISKEFYQQFTFMLYMTATRPHGQAQHRLELKAGPGNPGGGRRWERGAAEVGGVIEGKCGRRGKTRGIMNVTAVFSNQ